MKLAKNDGALPTLRSGVKSPVVIRLRTPFCGSLCARRASLCVLKTESSYTGSGLGWVVARFWRRRADACGRDCICALSGEVVG